MFECYKKNAHHLRCMTLQLYCKIKVMRQTPDGLLNDYFVIIPLVKKVCECSNISYTIVNKLKLLLLSNCCQLKSHYIE